jgi:hypothetical protein
VQDGLYAYGQSRRGTGVQPDVPDGEPDAFDAPPLPYMLVRRPPERESEAGG